MNQKLTNFFKSTRYFLGKHSPEILTGIGIAGMISSTVLAVKATPKALILINEEKKKRSKLVTEDFYADNEKYSHQELVTSEDLGVLDTIKVAWKPYIPSAVVGIASISCLIGASATNYKRNAALASAYALSERTLTRYRDKVIETIGERKEKQIKEKVAQEEVNDNKLSNSQIVVTSKGNTLCMDTMSGRYFKSDIETIKQAVNKLNRRLIYENYISLNEFYGEIGLDNVKNGDLVGWNLDSGMIEPTFSTCLAEDDQPCIVLDFMVCPRYDYDKLM